MKAGVIFEKGGSPVYSDFPEPIARNDKELVVSVEAVAIKHIDRSRANGQHYSAPVNTAKATIIGGDGVCVLPDGNRVYAIGTGGMLAQKAVVEKSRMVALPDSLDNITAAALPNAVMGSAMALRFRAGLNAGEIVLINGATGFTGKIAVQIAKLYGAGKIIVTGRDEATLESLVELGADEIISLKQDKDSLVQAYRKVHAQTPIDIVIDYLWGPTAELILSSFKGNGQFTHKTRFVSIGAVTGDLIQLSAENLRSVDLQLSGSGLGSWTKSEINFLFSNILPETFQFAADQKLFADTISMELKEIQTLWSMDIPAGKRLVVTI